MPEPTENGKMIAALAYGGFFFGFPLGIIPLVMRDDELAVFHGRHATAAWLLHMSLVMVLTFVVSVIGIFTCGLGYILLPVIFLPIMFGAVTSVHGIILALNGEMVEPFGGMGLGDMLFSGITVNVKASEAPAALPDHGDDVRSTEVPAPDADGDDGEVEATEVPPPPPVDQSDVSEVPPPPPPVEPSDVSEVPPPPPVEPSDVSDAPPPPPRQRDVSEVPPPPPPPSSQGDHGDDEPAT